VTALRWTEQAVQDLESIRLHRARLSAVRTPVFERLEIIVGDYRIVYRLTDELAVLITVHRASMLFPYHLADE